MVSKRFLLIALAFATVLLIASEIAAAKELASNHEGEVEDAKFDRGYNGRGGYYNSGGRGGYHNGGGRGGYYNGGGHGRPYCRHGCCSRYYNGGCSCCRTLEEANAYKQAQEAQTHN